MDSEHNKLDNAINIKAKIYRYKLSETICDILLEFSQQHKFDVKDDFNEYWKQWTIENENSINKEKQRLESLGFYGDVVKKMYKSVRYYYCKKHNEKNRQQDKRRTYISKNQDFIDSVDSFIKSHCIESRSRDGEIIRVSSDVICELKPSKGWNVFYEKYTNSVIKDEIERIMYESNDLSHEDALTKIRKTFNNRYYINVRSKATQFV
jgi:hypothetical protein